jgi:hypothetical protein
MRAYTAFSKTGGPEEGAILVFASSVKEAKAKVYPLMLDEIWQDWIDLGVKWIKEPGHLFECADQNKLAKNEAHVIYNPPSCRVCYQWGPEISDNGELCSYCHKECLGTL